MMLKVLLPGERALKEEVEKINAEGRDGAFGVLPRHIDFATALAPGILAYWQKGREYFMAVDEGIMVKTGDQVLVSVRSGYRGDSLGSLRETVEREFQKLGDRERRARSVLADLEAEFVRKFLDLQTHE